MISKPRRVHAELRLSMLRKAFKKGRSPVCLFYKAILVVMLARIGASKRLKQSYATL